MHMNTKFIRSFYTLACISVWIAWIIITFTERIHYAKKPEQVYATWLIVRSLQGFNGIWATLLLFRIYKIFEKKFVSVPLKVLWVISLTYGFSLFLVYMNYPIYSYMFKKQPIFLSFGGYCVEAFSKFFVVLLLGILYFFITHLLELKKQKERTLEALAIANEAQLQMLRYQLNPHFLFNALNSIRSLVYEDIHKADQTITDLSEFLRYSLSNEANSKVSLSDEIRVIQTYLQIQKIRFEDKIEVEISIAKEASQADIPCFLIHPLVENAVKYGLKTSTPPLKIRIQGKVIHKKLVISVQNSGRLCQPEDCQCHGTGLKNIQLRLSHLYPDKSSFELSEDTLSVTALITIDLGGN